MSKVIEFPNASARNDAEIEKALREGLAGHGFSEKAIDSAVSRAMPLLQESRRVVCQNMNASLSGSMSEEQIRDLESQLSSGFQKYQEEISEYIQKLIVQIAWMEAQGNDA